MKFTKKCMHIAMCLSVYPYPCNNSERMNWFLWNLIISSNFCWNWIIVTITLEESVSGRRSNWVGNTRFENPQGVNSRVGESKDSHATVKKFSVIQTAKLIYIPRTCADCPEETQELVLQFSGIKCQILVNSLKLFHYSLFLNLISFLYSFTHIHKHT